MEYNEVQEMLSFGEGVCSLLLRDQTTQQNIYWATNSYENLGDGYSFFDPITLDKIIGKDKEDIIRPRNIKTREEQFRRTKSKAEVFTPSWICNAQNNLIDEAWFGRNNELFNSVDPNDSHRWINNEEKIIFPNTEGKTWKDYVADVRLEITCGEAPYLCNRYDVVTGEPNINAKYRIGLLDRKLRIVSENTDNVTDWLLWSKIALRATYGYEWQGDNLLLARINILYTFIEHFIERFDKETFENIKDTIMPSVIYIISWNVWQMDGLTFGLPAYHSRDVIKKKKKKEPLSLFDEMAEDNTNNPYKSFCVLKDFFNGININDANLTDDCFNDKEAPQQTFYSLLSE